MQIFKQNWHLALDLKGRIAIYSVVLCTSTACSSLPQTVGVDFPETSTPRLTSPMLAAPAPATGSLFHKAAYRPGFEDSRARAVGDNITIQIVEKVTASQVSKSTANRTTSGSTSVSAFPFISPPDIANFTTGTKSASDFSGKGGTESANTFFGTITATVVEVLPNGHLLVAGDKQIGVNQNVDVMRFSGSIDPRLIQPGNLVNSNQVANARMESKGRGAQAEAQTVGWLTRFFFSFLPF
ncbi:MAG: flagellar basal body L-ring protein FlgH [Rhodoferax sp.]|nr:flagellar basal body L-ring protein FlgH [Betaproteobacteria bacterium]NCN98078.1 flagellar basal body L-ring protein FlgH [Rhodoferax sp.]NCS60158.1 flagellar basal body L-ring protein FlgH [Rhodoferax sp.]PIZ21650.1 MAG: flagellar biosynthesis protein FlgH [Comamonadaceae bacterium CG_4_10_14_0_8_um_filter_57_29]PJC14180.1 MAG: flagellar biosynthesis protein FlgH [Comamonadaceae bacterium CG_4_9_14_0_8_um_filter_57_21]